MNEKYYEFRDGSLAKLHVPEVSVINRTEQGHFVLQDRNYGLRGVQINRGILESLGFVQDQDVRNIMMLALAQKKTIGFQFTNFTDYMVYIDNIEDGRFFSHNSRTKGPLCVHHLQNLCHDILGVDLNIAGLLDPKVFE